MLIEHNSSVSDTNRIFFQWYDHTLFGCMLLISTAIGIYFSCVGGKKKDTTDEYFMGGKKMSVLPIAMSLVASHVSGVTLVSVPAEVYSFGAMYWLSTISIFFVAVATSYLFLPIFFDLQLNSTYEYLNLRFSPFIRSVCSLLFVLNILLYMAIVVYVPALAYSQATGISIYYIIPCITAICTFYTTIGGLKAVVWTDTLQFSLTVGAVLIVFVLGFIKAGGVGAVFETAYYGERLKLDFGFDLTKRETVFAVLMHWFLIYIRMTAMSQECVLKFLSLPSLKKARQSIFVFCFGIIIVKTVIVITGLIIYALYNRCDPLSAGLVKKTDQLVPFFVADVAENIPGLTGLFISGVFCTALSTLSAAINALSATVYQDFISKYVPKWTDNEKTAIVIKVLVVIMGIIISCLAIVVQSLGPILPLAISISSLSGGSFIGLFTLGVLCPRANTKGAFWGILSSTIFITWLFVGSQFYKAKAVNAHVSTHLTTDQCDFYIKPHLNSTFSDSPDEIFYLYRISHYYYALIGCVICVVVGLIVSYMDKSKEPVDKRLLSPLVHFLVEDIKAKDTYYSIDEANRVVNTVHMTVLNN